MDARRGRRGLEPPPPPPHSESVGEESANRVSRSRSRADLRDITYSAASTSVIADLRDQLEEKDRRMNEMHAAMLAAGLLKAPTALDGEGSSHQVSQKDETRMRVVAENVNLRGGTYKTFLSCQPPSFKGGEDPLECKRWIRKIEQTFRAACVADSQKANYAIHLLGGEALEWWDSVYESMTVEARIGLTWENLVERINLKYCDEGLMMLVEREFLDLKKGSMSIAKFNTTFTEKLQFSRHLCPSKKSLVTRYAEGLPFVFSNTVRNQSTLEAAMGVAKVVEADLNEREKHSKVGDKRKFEGPSGSSKKKNSSFKRDDKKKGRGILQRLSCKAYRSVF